MSQYARRNDAGFYTVRGEKLLSVTTFLSSSPGSFLLPWAAKQSALKAASHLVQAGIADPRTLLRAGKITEGECLGLEEFCAGLVSRAITREEAVWEVMSWGRNMKEPERYRDFKASVGSIMHHATYQRTVQEYQPESADLPNYLRGVVMELGLCNNPQDPDYIPTDAQIDALAMAAESYVIPAFKFYDDLDPIPWVTGAEACIAWPLRSDPNYPDNFGYAGTMDAIWDVKRAKWQSCEKKYNLVPWNQLWPDKDQVRLLVDFKSSNALSVTFPAQLAAYRNAKVIVMMQTGTEVPMTEVDGTAILHVGPDENLSGLQTEFGVLKSKAKHTGVQLHCFPEDNLAWEAFVHLVHWVNWKDNPSKPIKREAAPKEPVVPKTVAKDKAPF